MAGTFLQRTEELADLVGHGDLVGAVEVDQVYAHYQHEGLDLHHPRGGQGKYLEEPFVGSAEAHMRRIAKQTLETGPAEGMREVVDQVSDDVKRLAPVEFDDLRRSAHPTVTDDGHVVYDQPPEVHRLTDEELRAKGHLRTLGYGGNVRAGRDGLPE